MDFALLLPNGRWTSFRCWWDFPTNEANVLDDANPVLDRGILAEAVPAARVRSFLGGLPTAAQEAEAIKGFARAMGFPEFDWLSPAYVSSDPEGAISRGGEEFGRRPLPGASGFGP